MRELFPLLLALGRGGIELAPHSIDPARLRHRAANLAPALAAGLRTHRAVVLALLLDGYTPADDAAAYIVGERLGVADELGLPTHPGSAAWLLAVGESIAFEPVWARAADGTGKAEKRASVPASEF